MKSPIGGTLGQLQKKTQSNVDSLTNRTFGKNTTKTMDEYGWLTGNPRVDPFESAQRNVNTVQGKKPDGGSSGNEMTRIGELSQEQRDRNLGFNKDLDTGDDEYLKKRQASGQSYLDSIGASSGNYKNEMAGIMNDAKQQAADSSRVYNSSIRPALQTMMDSDMQEAGNAMTLDEAGDVNNYIHQGVRDMYNRQGSNVIRQGQQSSAVLGALGAQNAASAFGSMGPMTVGQQQALYASSQGQAGQAFARAQAEMSRLRQQGIDRGFDESDAQYQRGERAKGRAKDAVGQFGAEEDRFQERQGNYRSEIGRGAADIFGLDMGLASANRDFGDEMAGIGQNNIYNRTNRNMGVDDIHTRNQMNVQLGRAAERQADAAGKAGVFSGILGAVGTGVGAYYGGPGGAAAGGAAGTAIGGAMAPRSGPVTYPGIESPPPQQQGGYTPYSPYGQRAYA